MVNHAPQAVGLWKIRSAFVHEGRGAVLQGSINDIAMTGDPADVGGAPVHVLFLEVKDQFRRDVSTHGIPAGGVQDALRFARRAGRIQKEERVLGIERLCRALIRCLQHQFMPPMIAAGGHSHR
jgi:hypothetical protein